MCDKCDDIHTAQREGKQEKPCSCVCHPVTNIPAPDYRVSCTCDSTMDTTAPCPIHGYVTTYTSTFIDGSTTWTGSNFESKWL